ncbi:MAG: hypothetical protein HY287_00650 [Planctomycetes bacterium]|nr:hypothetical protein [Planctomycetota bacterium]
MNDDEICEAFEKLNDQLTEAGRLLDEHLQRITAMMVRYEGSVDSLRHQLSDHVVTRELTILDSAGQKRASLSVLDGRALLILADDAGRNVVYAPSLPGESSENSGSPVDDTDPQGP